MYIFIINVKVKNKDKLLKMKKLLKIFIIYSKISYSIKYTDKHRSIIDKI